MSLDRCWQLALAWYSADRRAPEWRRRNASETEEVFASLRLTGSFWELA